MATQASAFHLQWEETPQAVPCRDAGFVRRTWFFEGMGFAALMLIGVYSIGGSEFQHGSASDPGGPAGHEAAVAGWYHTMPGIRAGGLRGQQTKTPSQTAGRAAAEMLHMSEDQTWAGYIAKRQGTITWEPSMSAFWTGAIDGKGFGGGEATRDPEPTYIDPNDPKGKQHAIHKAESFSDYMAKRSDYRLRDPDEEQAMHRTESALVAAESEAAAKAAWVAQQEAAASGQDSAIASEERAKAAWLAKQEAPAWTPKAAAAKPVAAAAPVAAASLDAAKAVWPAWGQGGGVAAPAAAAPAAAAAPVAAVAPSASPSDEAAARAAWLAKQGAAAWGQGGIAHHSEGKGFGDGEATRDPEPTYIDPNDPKGKQQAIHKAESFADYMARRTAHN